MAARIERFLGRTGINIMTRVMALIVAAIGVNFIMIGIRANCRDWLAAESTPPFSAAELTAAPASSAVGGMSWLARPKLTDASAADDRTGGRCKIISSSESSG
jgi:MarC family integral membrane protein